MTEASLGILARLEAKPDKAEAVKTFLKDALALAREESGTSAWFAVQLDSTTFGIFDAFVDEDARQAHLNGAIAQALMSRADELLASPPSIEKADILAAKLPAR